MAKKSYLPDSDAERIVWFNNFSAKFSVLATSLGFTAADIASVANDAAMFAYSVFQVESYVAAKELRVSFKKLMKDGPIGKPGGTIPLPPVAPTPPTMVAPGIFPRLSMLVPRIKNFPAYTEGNGRDLGIIGAEEILDTAAMKPILYLVNLAGQVEVQWTKGQADALYIESDKGTGWQFLAVDVTPQFIDTTPVTGPAVWKYRAIYLIDDEKVGQMSDVVIIGVS